MSTEAGALYPTAYVGSFCIYFNAEAGVIMLIERGKHEGYGVPGGYMDIGTTREQPRENALRELCEEVVLPDGSPVLKTITPDRMEIIDSGFDYNAAIPGTNHMGTCWNAFKCALTKSETDIVIAHSEKMRSDDNYNNAVQTASNHELKSVFFVKASTLPDDVRSGKIAFKYEHEQRMALAVANMMNATASSPAPRA